MFFESQSLRWFAVQVRSNHERIANAILEQKGFYTFLPLYRSQSRWSDRMKTLERPLFPGYLFCLLDPQKRQAVVTVNCIVRIVGVGRTPVPVDAAELSGVQAVVSCDLPYEPHQYLSTGESVRIIDGPLRGLEGIFQRHRGVHRLIVSVNLIRQSVAVEVDHSHVVPLAACPRPSPSYAAGTVAQMIN